MRGKKLSKLSPLIVRTATVVSAAEMQLMQSKFGK